MELSEITKDVERHNGICRELLEIVQQENRWLSSSKGDASQIAAHQKSKTSLSKSLTEVVAKIQGHRAALQDASKNNPDAPKHKEIQSAIQSATDLIMKIVVIDRENEKLLMKQGMVPAESIPSSYQYRPSDALKAYQSKPS
ncbi:MAG TPA: hypothetical protein DCR17_10100 [Verrucomicrobiales bacterium]|nr:hypothetical protein [Verrucomicrobiales bacterium]HBP56821.1 hypothetical protein [Verrucomicrobiales bacterium]|tara:strand:- start:5267 stop:5692 length:426 start_codon:yes stop_codon:yes gene_type:complete